MKKLIFILAAILLIASCSTKRKTVKTEVKIDTVTVYETKIDTVHKLVRVGIKPPAINETKLNPCDSLGNVKKTSIEIKEGSNTVVIKDTMGMLLIRSRCAEQIDSVVKEYRGRIHELEKNQISISEKTSEDLKVRSVWTKWTWIFLGIAILLLLILLSRLKKFFPTII